MATKLAPPTPTQNTMQSQKPPFRRQGSSVNAGVHPMTVAIAPIPKVDYSVTKGGARTWAVLLVFFFLCSSLYTVFSVKEIAELAVDLDDDGEFDLDGDVNDNSDEVVANNRKIMKDTQPSNEQAHVQEKESHRHAHSAPSKKAEVQPPAGDEDEEDSFGLGGKLFARLRRKMERNLKKAVDMVRNVDVDGDEEEADEKPMKKTKSRRKKKKMEEQQEEQTEEPAEEPVVEEPKIVIQEREPPRREKKQKRKEPEPDEQEEELLKPDEPEEEAANNDDDAEGEPEKEQVETEDEEDEEKENGEIEEKQPDEPDEQPQRQEPKWKETKPKERREKVYRKLRHITDQPAERECKRKNCPQPNFAEPRMWLLIHRPKKDEEDDAEKEIDDAVDEELDNNEDAENESEGEAESQPVTELVAVKKYRSTGREAYKRHAITNKDDHRFRDNLDKADSLVEKHDYESAIAIFDQILKMSPDSPRAHFGKGRAYQIRAEFTTDENDWYEAIKEFEEVLENDETPDALFRQAASRLIDCSRFRGDLHKTISAHRALIDRFSEEMKLQTDFALTFLMMKRHEDARKILKNVLDVEPHNGIALAYYGYILKIIDNDIEQGVNYMRKGLRMAKDNILDPKFYYHLGQGLTYLGRDEEAHDAYSQAADLGVFLSPEQRSLYNIDGLTARPWWNLEQTGYGRYLKAIERQWVIIRHEALHVLKEYQEKWEDENEMLCGADGQWKAFKLMTENRFVKKNCELAKKTCFILEEFDRSSNASQAEMRFSVLTSGAQILPHCGPTNTRLQAHLGLIVPSEARIRVSHEERGWKTGKFIIFDDSFEHEMRMDGAPLSAFRLVLTIELWHPEVDDERKASHELMDED